MNTLRYRTPGGYVVQIDHPPSTSGAVLEYCCAIQLIIERDFERASIPGGFLQRWDATIYTSVEAKGTFGTADVYAFASEEDLLDFISKVEEPRKAIRLTAIPT